MPIAAYVASGSSSGRTALTVKLTMRDVIISAMLWRLKRQIRRPSAWLIVLIAPIAAHYLLPPAGASYTLLSINKQFIEVDGASLGLKLGVIVVTSTCALAANAACRGL
jgi:hypothetical protein